jgi:hypothetical protein
MNRLVRPAAILLLSVCVLTAGCATLAAVAALRAVEFALERVTGGRLAGVDLDRYRAGGSLNPLDAGRVAVALGRGSLPLSFTLHVGAENPADNPPARLVGLDWTLFVEGRETISGVFNDERTLASGARTDLPITMELDLVQFFGTNSRDLANLALNLAGAGGDPAMLRLEAQPSINTEFGPIRYPGRITIQHEVGR